MCIQNVLVEIDESPTFALPAQIALGRGYSITTHTRKGITIGQHRANRPADRFRFYGVDNRTDILRHDDICNRIEGRSKDRQTSHQILKQFVW